jgi:hypothetical protein
MGILLLTTFMITSFSVVNIGYCKEKVTVEWWYWEDISNPRSYWRLMVTYSDHHVEWYDGWCADLYNYLNRHGSAEVYLYSSTEDNLPYSIHDDERWDVVNYIFNQWYAGLSPFNGATWKDVQQVVWIYTDTGYSPSASSYTPPEANWDKVNEIKSHIDSLGSIPGGYYEAMILDLNHPIGICVRKQLLFFVVPEVPLGVLGAVTTMFGAYLTKIRLSRRKKQTP